MKRQAFYFNSIPNYTKRKADLVFKIDNGYFYGK